MHLGNADGQSWRCGISKCVARMYFSQKFIYLALLLYLFLYKKKKTMHLCHYLLYNNKKNVKNFSCLFNIFINSMQNNISFGCNPFEDSIERSFHLFGWINLTHVRAWKWVHRVLTLQIKGWANYRQG